MTLDLHGYYFSYSTLEDQVQISAGVANPMPLINDAQCRSQPRANESYDMKGIRHKNSGDPDWDKLESDIA